MLYLHLHILSITIALDCKLRFYYRAMSPRCEFTNHNSLSAICLCKCKEMLMTNLKVFSKSFLVKIFSMPTNAKSEDFTRFSTANQPL